MAGEAGLQESLGSHWPGRRAAPDPQTFCLRAPQGGGKLDHTAHPCPQAGLLGQAGRAGAGRAGPVGPPWAPGPAARRRPAWACLLPPRAPLLAGSSARLRPQPAASAAYPARASARRRQGEASADGAARQWEGRRAARRRADSAVGLVAPRVPREGLEGEGDPRLQWSSAEGRLWSDPLPG